jgi:hypothetical protein
MLLTHLTSSNSKHATQEKGFSVGGSDKWLVGLRFDPPIENFKAVNRAVEDYPGLWWMAPVQPQVVGKYTLVRDEVTCAAVKLDPIARGDNA